MKYIDDEWERFIIKFSIYYPLKDEMNEYMRINGNIVKLGSWNIYTNKEGDGP